MPLLKNPAKAFLILAVSACGILIAGPYVDIQGFLSQGDHGRDLYAAQAVFRGELPYKDFWWVYGPLMPYYYGLFFKIYGTTIQSVLLGKVLLRILAGIFVCLGMMEVCCPPAAFFCAVWFLLFQQDFFFTYNHIGGLAMVLATAFCLLVYIQRKSSLAAWSALGFIFILCLIKINFGLAALAVCVITVGVCDFVYRIPFQTPKKLFFLAGLIGVPLLAFLVYWSLLHGLSVMEIRQCLPYKEGDQPYSTTPWAAISQFLKFTWHTITSSWANIGFAVLINACALRCLYLIVKNKLPPARKTVLILSLGMLGFFYVANSHEYLKSGVWYRLFWAQPLDIMITFVLIDAAVQDLPAFARRSVFTLIGIMSFISWFVLMGPLNAMKTHSQYLSLPRASVYVSNSPSWIATVEETTQFLNKTLKPNELFFALPYDCLYYYLTDKKTPTRQLIFFEHIRIPPEQEKSVIADLERNHVNYILVSSRAFAHLENGLGTLGTTYCPLIGQYIQDNFTPLVRFGDWSDEPGWAWNHGTCILKRKKPL